MLILEISHWLVEVVVWLQQRQTVVDWGLLTPWTEVKLGYGLGTTGENAVTGIQMINKVQTVPFSSLLHSGWSPEGERLHLLYVVTIVTGQPGQTALSNLNRGQTVSQTEEEVGDDKVVFPPPGAGLD